MTSNYKIGMGDLALRAEGRFYYLASPYTHEHQWVVEERVGLAHEYYCEFTLHGLHIHNAVFESHQAAKTHKLPTHFQFWLEHNSTFIKPSAGIIICELNEWESSKGIKSEIEEARSLGLPVYGAYLHPVQRHMYIREMYRVRVLTE